MIKQVQRKNKTYAFQWFGVQSMADLGEFMGQLGYGTPQVRITGNSLTMTKETIGDDEPLTMTAAYKDWVITEGGAFPFRMSADDFRRQFETIRDTEERAVPMPDRALAHAPDDIDFGSAPR